MGKALRRTSRPQDACLVGADRRSRPRMPGSGLALMFLRMALGGSGCAESGFRRRVDAGTKAVGDDVPDSAVLGHLSKLAVVVRTGRDGTQAIPLLADERQ